MRPQTGKGTVDTGRLQCVRGTYSWSENGTESTIYVRTVRVYMKEFILVHIANNIHYDQRLYWLGIWSRVLDVLFSTE